MFPNKRKNIVTYKDGDITYWIGIVVEDIKGDTVRESYDPNSSQLESIII